MKLDYEYEHDCEWVRIWVEAVVAYFRVESQHSSGETEENEEARLGEPVGRPKLTDRLSPS